MYKASRVGKTRLAFFSAFKWNAYMMIIPKGFMSLVRDIAMDQEKTDRPLDAKITRWATVVGYCSGLVILLAWAVVALYKYVMG